MLCLFMINSCMILIRVPGKKIEGLFGISLEENFLSWMSESLL